MPRVRQCVRRRSKDVDRLERRRYRAGKRDWAHEQPQFRRARNQNPDPDQPAVSVPRGRHSAELFAGLGLSVGYTTGGSSAISGRAVWSSTRSRLHARSDSRSSRQRGTLPVYNLAEQAGLIDDFDSNSSVNETISGHRRHGERAVARRNVSGRNIDGPDAVDPEEADQQLAFLRSDGVRVPLRRNSSCLAAWAAMRRSPGGRLSEPARERTHRHLCGHRSILPH
jgi:hypothetical protein